MNPDLKLRQHNLPLVAELPPNEEEVGGRGGGGRFP